MFLNNDQTKPYKIGGVMENPPKLPIFSLIFY